MAEKSKILIIGGTGYIGKFIVEASANMGHPTFVLVRESTLSDPSKSSVIDCFKKAGINIITGDLHDHERLITAIKQVDVVISAVGVSQTQLADQVKIIAAIKEAGNIKKFYPSEFGNDVDRSHAVEPAKTLFATKAQVRRAIEAENIPYTYISSNCFAGYLLPTLAQSGVTAPPRDKVVSLGDGNAKDENMAEKSKILIIGGTGYIGKFIVEASANMGHPTFVLVRESTLSDPSKSSVIDCFKKAGVNIITGDLHDHERLITAIKQVDVVISAVGVSQTQLADQVKIIAAIKEAGNIKKFYPSEFGNDADRSHAVEPAKTLFATKAQVRRAIEAENIPYTYISSNCFAGYLLPTLAQSGVTAPPRDKVVSLGDGNAKGSIIKGPLVYNICEKVGPPLVIFEVRTIEGQLLIVRIIKIHYSFTVFNEEHDIATYTIKTVDDPRTVNKSVYINPPGNIYSFNELVSLWEKKIGKTLEKVYLSEDQVLKNIEESPLPHSLIMSISHTVFVKGDQTNFEIEPSFGVEASELYPDVKYTTVDEYLSRFV
uniref:Putative NAD(P)-binding domain-containing protein n=1 Tax=Helianthus annuus TaxID=4232 RepID=A0A251V7C9_HELAN